MTAEKKKAAKEAKAVKNGAKEAPHKMPKAHEKKKVEEVVVKKAVKEAAKETKKCAAAEETKELAEEKKPAEKEEKEVPAKKPAKKAAAEKPKAEAPKEEKKKKEKKERKKKPVEKIAHSGPKTLSAEEKKMLSRKKKKPRFIRQEYYKLPRLKDVWRKSRGIDSKKHEGKRGKGETPNAGYKNQEAIRGIHKKGYYPILVHNTMQLEKIDHTREAAVIAAAVGRRSRNEIIASANKLKITILNPRRGELK